VLTAETLQKARDQVAALTPSYQPPIVSPTAFEELRRRKPCGHLLYFEGCFCESEPRPKE
jgi:hypothetical protein